MATQTPQEPAEPTLTRYRVTLDIAVDRSEHNRPDEWDWPDLIGGFARLVDCERVGETDVDRWLGNDEATR